MKHDRKKCLYCGKPINRHEMLYGACSACLKQRARERHWHPTNNDKGTWLYADMAPRMKEYVNPHDLDDRGTMLLYRIINRDTGAFSPEPDYDKMPAWNEDGEEPKPEKPGPPKGSRILYRFSKGKHLPPVPDGMKRCTRCGKLIPIAGYTKCEACRKKCAESARKWRAKLAGQHRCKHCSKVLPADYTFKNCPECRALYRAQKEKRKGVTPV